MELEAIPGVGTKTAESLESLEDPIGAIEHEDVSTLASAPGISESKAARIVRAAVQVRHDDPGGFLATNRAEEIYDAVLSLLQERAVTEYGRQKLSTLYPSSAASRIKTVQERAEAAMDRQIDPAVLEALEKVEPLDESQDVTVRDRCLATGDAETYSEATAAFPEVSVELVDDARNLAELARGYSTVIALDSTFAGVDVDGDVRVDPDAMSHPESIVPERVLDFFARNRDSIRAAMEVHEVAALETDVECEPIREGLDRLREDGTVRGDDELERLSTAVEDLDTAADTAESVANDRLTEAIKETDVTIDGADLLSLVERGAGVDSLLERELAEEFEAAVEAARGHFVEALQLEGGEVATARRVFPDEPTFPVSRDESVVGELRDSLRAERDRLARKRKQEVAEALADRHADVEELVATALELDVELAIAQFARDFECRLPERKGRGFDIQAGRCPLLDEPFEAVEPVDYGVDGVALLSGVNSGGKTSTIDLVATVTILAHMGLPVPAEFARVPAVQELHYHAKTQGTLDAGAFEATLRDFASVTDGAATKLVLVDELESITEPGASAKIIAGILEVLSEKGATAVFVSHLAGQIRDACEFEMTVDGIEALGLEDGELKVDRSPVKDHLARSTPELIVEKLATNSAEGDPAGKATETAQERAFYERLLEKF